ncbi:MAG: protease inhibitor I42 family protein [Lachnospiraceae bacterium]|jgi:predicted secreted protein|nr:protease inhibitor I42 family protein [Lachnospiraceae bacterium]MCI1726295.1 protease inhibitor I42 family protein [Lachnospiraceae bacterium]
MKKLTALLLCLILAVTVLAGCSKSSGVKEGADFSGNTLTVTLESNPTTGYTWEQSISNPSILEFTSDTYVSKTDSTGSALDGAGGYDHFTFKSLAEGTAVVTFTYGQNWEGGEKAETQSVTVEVDSKGNISSINEKFADGSGVSAGASAAGSGASASVSVSDGSGSSASASASASAS